MCTEEVNGPCYGSSFAAEFYKNRRSLRKKKVIFLAQNFDRQQKRVNISIFFHNSCQACYI